MLFSIKVDTPTIRMVNFHQDDNNKGLRAKLDLIEELGERAWLWVLAFKQRVKLVHNAKLQPKQLEEGSFMLYNKKWMAKMDLTP